MSWWDDFWSAVGQAVEEGAQAAADTAAAVAEAVEEVVETVTQAASDAADATEQAAGDAGQFLGGMADAAFGLAREVGGITKQTAQGAKDTAFGMASDVGQAVKDTIREVVQDPAGAWDDTKQTVREVVQDPVGTATGAAEAAKQAVREAADEGKSAARETAEAVADATGRAAEAAFGQEPVGDAAGAVAEATAGAADADAAPSAGGAGWLLEESARWYGGALQDAAALYTEVAGPDLARPVGRAEVQEAAARAVDMTGGLSTAPDPGVEPGPVADPRAAPLHQLREEVLVSRQQRVEQLRELRQEDEPTGVDPAAAAEALRALVTEQATGHGALLAVAAARGAALRNAAAVDGHGSLASVLVESARTEVAVAETAAAEAAFLAEEAAQARLAAVEAQAAGDPAAAARLQHVAQGLAFVGDRSIVSAAAARRSAEETVATSGHIAENRPDLVPPDTIAVVADLADLTEAAVNDIEGAADATAADAGFQGPGEGETVEAVAGPREAASDVELPGEPDELFDRADQKDPPPAERSDPAGVLDKEPDATVSEDHGFGTGADEAADTGLPPVTEPAPVAEDPRPGAPADNFSAGAGPEPTEEPAAADPEPAAVPDSAVEQESLDESGTEPLALDHEPEVHEPEPVIELEALEEEPSEPEEPEPVA